MNETKEMLIRAAIQILGRASFHATPTLDRATHEARLLMMARAVELEDLLQDMKREDTPEPKGFFYVVRTDGLVTFRGDERAARQAMADQRSGYRGAEWFHVYLSVTRPYAIGETMPLDEKDRPSA